MNIMNKVEEIQLMRKSFIEWETNSSQVFARKQR